MTFFGKNFEKLTVFSASTTKKSPPQVKNLGTPFFTRRRRAKNFPRTPQKKLVTRYGHQITIWPKAFKNLDGLLGYVTTLDPLFGPKISFWPFCFIYTNAPKSTLDLARSKLAIIVLKSGYYNLSKIDFFNDSNSFFTFLIALPWNNKHQQISQEKMEENVNITNVYIFLTSYTVTVSRL